MKLRKFAIISILLSVLLHLAIFSAMSELALDNTRLGPLFQNEQEIDFDQAITFHLEEPPQPPEPEAAPLPEEPSLNDSEARQLENTALEAPPVPEVKFAPETEQVAELLKKAEFVDEPVTVYDIQGVQGALVPSRQLATPSAEELLKPPTAPRPEILEIKASDLSQERLDLPGRMTTPELHRSAVASDVMLPSLAQDGPLAAGAPLTAGLQLRGRRPGFGAPDANMPGLELPAGGMPGAGTASVPRPGDELANRKVKPSDVPLPLDDFVQVIVTVQMESNGRGGCFQVDILPARNSDALPDIAKDLLFIIDRSASISPAKFAEFQKAVIEILPAVSANDRFNIISFSDKPTQYFKDFASGTAVNRAAAASAIKKLPHGGMTDVFGGLAPYVRQSNGSKLRPLNIFLLTDGQSTVNIHEPNVFLREIVSMNPGNVSIFPFSADKKANRQLLDFLGYLNRGDKCHVETIPQIGAGMAEFYSRHASIIVMDVTCKAFAGAHDIFPKSLSHLYRSGPLRLFGRFDDPSQELVLAITGRDAEGQLRDLVFRRRLDQCPKGDSFLIQRWAGQKILYLLARCNSSDNQAEIRALRRQIDLLSKQYSVYSGY